MNKNLVWGMFLDDERFPSDTWKIPVIIVRNVNQAVDICEKFGCPSFISFDHDLGSSSTGYDFAKWLVEQDLNKDGRFIPKDFDFWVHSQNPIGADSIKNYLLAYIRIKDGRSND